jgi:flagellar biosynthetic protein FlhB
LPDDFGDRTEDPTEFRRDEARRKGQVARSTDLNAAGGMFAAAGVMLAFGMAGTRSLAEIMQQGLVTPQTQLESGDVSRRFSELLEAIAPVVLPVMGLMVLVGVGLNLMQFGFLLTWDALTPNFSRINPLSGVKRLFSIQSVMKLGVSLGKLLVVVVISVLFISRAMPVVLQFVEVEWQTTESGDPREPFREEAIAPPLMSHVWAAVVRLAFEMAAALIVLGIIDYAFQRWKHTQDLRMTKQEVRDEMKNFEGDPATRMRRRETHRKLAQARELGQVPNADVVITNPTHIAVAIKFDPETMNAPTVLAKGQGEIARRIREVAASHRIPIIERKPLARALYQQVKVGQEIPLDMYQVFVEIMAYVYQISGKMPGTRPK